MPLSLWALGVKRVSALPGGAESLLSLSALATCFPAFLCTGRCWGWWEALGWGSGDGASGDLLRRSLVPGLLLWSPWDPSPSLGCSGLTRAAAPALHPCGAAPGAQAVPRGSSAGHRSYR